MAIDELPQNQPVELPTVAPLELSAESMAAVTQLGSHQQHNLLRPIAVTNAQRERANLRRQILLKQGLTIAQVADRMKTYWRGVQKRARSRTNAEIGVNQAELQYQQPAQTATIQEIPQSSPPANTSVAVYKPNASYMPTVNPKFRQAMQTTDNISTIDATDLLNALATVPSNDLARGGATNIVGMGRNVGNQVMNAESPIQQQRALEQSSPTVQQRAIMHAPSPAQQQRAIMYGQSAVPPSPQEVLQSHLQNIDARDENNWSMTMPPFVPGVRPLPILHDDDDPMNPLTASAKRKKRASKYVTTALPHPANVSETPPSVLRAAKLKVWLPLPSRKRQFVADVVKLNAAKGSPPPKKMIGLTTKPINVVSTLPAAP
jgi:hypothetical protein